MDQNLPGGPVLALKAVTALLLDLVLIQWLIRFRDGISELRRTREGGFAEDHRKCARKQCRRSRAIRFHLGPPEDAPVEAVREIIDLFRLAAKEIDIPSDPVYRDNILRRAKAIETRLERVGESQSCLFSP